MLKNLRALVPLGALLVLAATSLSQAPTGQENRIRVEIAGLRSDKGQVLCALFSSAKDFPKNNDKAMAHAKAEITHGQAVCEFRDIAVGIYAVSVFHDENSNGKLDANFMGIPREASAHLTTPLAISGPRNFPPPLFSFQVAKSI